MIVSSLSKASGRFRKRSFRSVLVDAIPFSAEKAAQRAREPDRVLLSRTLRRDDRAAGGAPVLRVSDRARRQNISGSLAAPWRRGPRDRDVSRSERADSACRRRRSRCGRDPDRRARSAPSAALRDAAYRSVAAAWKRIRRWDLETLEKLALLQRVDEAYGDADRLPRDRPGTEATETLFTTRSRRCGADPRFMSHPLRASGSSRSGWRPTAGPTSAATRRWATTAARRRSPRCRPTSSAGGGPLTHPGSPVVAKRS